MPRVTGRILNERWGIGARHALYSKRGNWYHLLERFPGALCDATGYILFESQEDITNYPEISISSGDKNWIGVRGGISAMKGYVRHEP